MHCPQPESHLNFIATLVLHRLHSRGNKEDISALNHVSVTFFSKKNLKTQKAIPPKVKGKKLKIVDATRIKHNISISFNIKKQTRTNEDKA